MFIAYQALKFIKEHKYDFPEPVFTSFVPRFF